MGKNWETVKIIELSSFEYWKTKLNKVDLLRVDEYKECSRCAAEYYIYLVSVWYYAEYRIGFIKLQSFHFQQTIYFKVKDGVIVDWRPSDEFMYSDA